ncbi:MAG: hypothetical protein Q7U47_04250 [Paludibacter sp.]|nr:hypothetical protein [Paludibacter sp.]
MKKLIFVLSLLIGISAISFAQTKQIEKALAKQYKMKMKEYKKEGWKLDGSSKTLDVALLLHYEKMKSADYKEIPGLVSNCVSKNVCRQAAYNNVIVSYANLASSYIKGRITNDMQIDQSNVNSGEFDKMYAAYERLVAGEIKGEIEESYAIVRQNGDTKEYQIIFLVNEKNASSKRLRALENAFKETSIAQEYAKKISEFVKEGFSY